MVMGIRYWVIDNGNRYQVMGNNYQEMGNRYQVMGNRFWVLVGNGYPVPNT